MISIPVTQEQLQNPCKGCKNAAGKVAACCQYILLENPLFDEDSKLVDYDVLLWWLTRRGIVVKTYMNSKGEASPKASRWEVYLETTCRYLRDDGMCGNYEERPVICSTYSPFPAKHDIGTVDGAAFCERYDPEATEEPVEFRCMEELDEFLRKHFNYDYRAHRVLKIEYIADALTNVNAPV